MSELVPGAGERARAEEEAGDPGLAARAPAPHDPIAALRSRDFRLYLVGNFVVTVGQQMQTTAIGWELYERTNNAFNLGLVGLVQMIPVVLLVLHAGSRRRPVRPQAGRDGARSRCSPSPRPRSR
jgi:hypothetical protein